MFRQTDFIDISDGGLIALAYKLWHSTFSPTQDSVVLFLAAVDTTDMLGEGELRTQTFAQVQLLSS